MAGRCNFVKAKVHPKFLHSNSTSHIWPFSAIAELIDNAYDPDVAAEDLWIDKEVVSSKLCLVVTDNGKGLSLDRLTNMLSLGFSEKAASETKYHKAVGRYGNGFKSGAMRLAKDALVLSVCQEEGTACVGLLSRTLCHERNLDEVVLPMVEFFLPDLEMTDPESQKDSLDAILETSPYYQEKDLKAELRKLMTRHRPGGKSGTGSGTKIVLFNLKRLQTKIGLHPYELDFIDSRCDAQDKSHSHSSLQLDQQQERRATDPAGDIRIHAIPWEGSSKGSVVSPSPGKGGQRNLDYQESLRAYCSFLYLNPRMNIYICGDLVKTLSIRAILKDAKRYQFVKKVLEQKRNRCEVLFGMAPRDLPDYGVMFYHKNRLIKPFVKLQCQKRVSKRLGMLVGEGVVGVVDVTDVLEPVHNKQDFATDNLLYRNIMSTLSSKLEEYCESFRQEWAVTPTPRGRGQGQDRKHKKVMPDCAVPRKKKRADDYDSLESNTEPPANILKPFNMQDVGLLAQQVALCVASIDGAERREDRTEPCSKELEETSRRQSGAIGRHGSEVVNLDIEVDWKRNNEAAELERKAEEKTHQDATSLDTGVKGRNDSEAALHDIKAETTGDPERVNTDHKNQTLRTNIRTLLTFLHQGRANKQKTFPCVGHVETIDDTLKEVLVFLKLPVKE